MKYSYDCLAIFFSLLIPSAPGGGRSPRCHRRARGQPCRRHRPSCQAGPLRSAQPRAAPRELASPGAKRPSPRRGTAAGSGPPTRRLPAGGTTGLTWPPSPQTRGRASARRAAVSRPPLPADGRAAAPRPPLPAPPNICALGTRAAVCAAPPPYQAHLCPPSHPRRGGEAPRISTIPPRLLPPCLRPARRPRAAVGPRPARPRVAMATAGPAGRLPPCPALPLPCPPRPRGEGKPRWS